MSQLPRYISNEDVRDPYAPSAQADEDSPAPRGVRENLSGSVVYFDPRTDTSPYAAKPRRKKGGGAPRKKTMPSNRQDVSGAEDGAPLVGSPYAAPDRSPYAAPAAGGAQAGREARTPGRRNAALRIVSDDPGEISRLAEDQLRSGVGTPARNDVRTTGQVPGQASGETPGETPVPTFGQASGRTAGRAAVQPAARPAGFRPEAVRTESPRPEAARTGRAAGERAAGTPQSQSAARPFAADAPSFLTGQRGATTPQAAASRAAVREGRRTTGQATSAPASAATPASSATPTSTAGVAAEAAVASSPAASSPAGNDDYKSRPSARPAKAAVADGRPMSERVWRALLVGVTVLSSIAVMLVMLYFPAQELYLNYRQQERLSNELDAVLARNKQMQDRVDSLQTAEGIQDEARLYHNLIMPDENAVYVSGTGYVAASTAIPAEVPRGSGENTDTWSTDLLDRVFGVTGTATAAASTEVATVVDAAAETDAATVDPDADIVAQGDGAAQ